MVLAEGRLPVEAETHEFFSPPLPYAFPALLLALKAAPAVVWKAGQFQNVVFALITLASLWALARQHSPQSRFLPAAALGLLGMMPVFYKTSVMLRGEPLLMAFVALAMLLTIRALDHAQFRSGRFAIIGLVLGLMILSRQWAFFALAGLIIAASAAALRGRIPPRTFALGFTLAGSIAFAVGGWFYLLHLQRTGSVTPFPLQRGHSFRLSNQPLDFYLGLGDGQLFRDPVRPSFNNQLWPIYYSEFWGDYWGYFVVNCRDMVKDQWTMGPFVEGSVHEGRVIPGYQTNRLEITPYLARVNMVSLLPSGLLLLGLALGARDALRLFLRREISSRVTVNALCFLVIACTWAGYLWFLIMYPKLPKGDTIKATYILQICPPLALLGASALQSISKRWRAVGLTVVVLLAAVAVHNLPACLTHFPS